MYGDMNVKVLKIFKSLRDFNPSFNLHLFNIVPIITQEGIRKLKTKLLEKSDQQMNRT